MSAGDYKYWGFVSYSHQDRRWGEWLHRAIESYRVPSRLAGGVGVHGPIPKKLFPIFRDRDELPTAGGLDAALTQALEQSRCFVLVCSPAAATSRWVNEEVLRFKQLGREARILCLIVDGEPNATDTGHPERECFPPALRYQLGADGQLSDIAAEPLAADLRETADGRDNARLKIIAGLLGVSFGELRQRDLQARNRRLGVLAGLSTAIAALTIMLAVQAVVARRAAEKSRQQGEDLIGFMLGDLREKLEPLGKLDILDAIGDKSMAYFDALDNRNLSEAAIMARAKALRQIGEVRFQQGRAADAATTLDSALALNQRLALLHPYDPDLMFELGQSEYWVGYSAWRANQLDRAETHFVAYRRISQQLVARDPAKARWQLELAYSASNLGALAYARGQYDDALSNYREDATTARALLARFPGDDETAIELAKSLSWQGTTLQSLDRLPEAIHALEEQAALVGSLSGTQPDDMRLKSDHARALAALGFATLDAGSVERAREVANQGKALISSLVANDPANQDYRRVAASHDYVLASVSLQQGDWSAAQRFNDSAQKLLQPLHATDPKLAFVGALLAKTWRVSYDLALAQKQTTAARDAVTQAIALCAAEAADTESHLDCARAHLMALELAVLGKDAAGANEHRRAVDAMLAIAENAGDAQYASSLRARLLMLGDEATEGARQLEALLAAGYRSPDFLQFVSRHCSSEPAHSSGLSCPSAVSRS